MSETFNIADPTMLLSIYNKDVREQRVGVHPWQARFHKKFADRNFNYKERVKRLALVANNGSGKSAMIVAPCSVWLCMAYPEAHAVITSSSGVQLDRQTGRAVNSLCQNINALHRKKIWDLKYREYRNTVTGSVIDMYATDEPGKAEGYHPISTGGMFAVFPDEAKSIPDNLFEPISRCNGMSHFIPVSSPGKPNGLFYRFVTSSKWDITKVTAYDCPHIKSDEIEEAKEIYGEFSAFFRSAYLAEFTSIDEQVVIPYEEIQRLVRQPPSIIDDKRKRCGVDLSGGGDENVVSIWFGNRQVALECFRFSDGRATVLHLATLFSKYGLRGEEINIDDGNVGRQIIHDLRDKGFNCNAVRFGARAFRHIAYGNRGTELYFNFQRLLPWLILLPDQTQKNQLSSRYYKQSDGTAKVILESKREAKAHGHHSPDRADGTVLAWANTPPNYFTELGYKENQAQASNAPNEWVTRLAAAKENPLTEEELAAAVEDYRNGKAKRESAREKSILGRIVSGDLRQMLGLTNDVDRRFTNIVRK